MVTPPETRRRWPRRLAQIVLGLGAAALVVGGLVAVGNAARDSLGPHDRYLLAFNEIECPSPSGKDRAEFLGEVQYNGAFPDRVYVLDPALPDRLRAAFARHPKVDRVGRITVIPPKRVQVELTFKP
ncbi:MAG TPA: hypothetical protein VKD90_17555 [Gemmataceae bacterium]|nr:hypothetical protein [Gemmataceae bacterium]